MHTKRTGGNHHVTTQDGFADLDVHLVGPHPILCHFLEKMAFHRIVSSCLGSSREMILDHSQTLAILVQNIILSPAPLYRIGAWAAPVCPRAIGLSETEKASLNDDRIARSLDALVSSQGRSLFFQLALHIINEFELDMKRIHQDTTSVKFFGNYSHSDVAPCITNGHSKDHRPDLKQLVFGLNVTADGAIPILHNIYSGNRTDDTVHCGNVDQLRKLLGKKDFIYVADSKLCTRKNMSHIASYKGKFITVLPRTRNEDKQFRSSLKEGYGVRWRRLLVMDNKRRENGPPDIYWTTSDGLNVTEEGYRLLWYRSSKKQKLDAQAREASLENAEAELYELTLQLNRRKLKSRGAIEDKIEQIFKKYHCAPFFNVTLDYHIKTETKRVRPGRPKKGDPVKIIRHRLFNLEFKLDKNEIEKDSRVDGVFPLVTNIPQKETPKIEVLTIYKYQPYVEKRFALFKTELGIAPVYLKKPSRCAGLLHATFLAMVLDALIERTVRQQMKIEGIKDLGLLPEDRPTTTPTTARILEAFSGVSWYEFKGQNETVVFPIKLNQTQKTVLRMLGMEQLVYSQAK